MVHNDTIIAQATAPGYGSVGILRISGLNAREIAKKVLGTLPKPRYASYFSFKDEKGMSLDQGIAIWYPAPNSFTGEDVLELQGHGSPVVLDLLLEYILTMPNVRIANPGEFSERAFLNDKIDLTQAEAIADLISSTSEWEARSALRFLQGDFSVRINHLSKILNHLRTYIEANIEIPEEGNEFFSFNDIKFQFEEIISYFDTIRFEAKQGNLLRKGIKVVIAGRPNTGKSSLFNRLTGKETAIITNIAGTTRDVLHEYIYIDGMPLYIIDTAGLHDTNNEIERIGIEKTWKEINQANHLIFMTDSTITPIEDPVEIWPDFITNLPANLPVTIVRNKSDITKELAGIVNINGYPIITLSAHTGEGVDILLHHLKRSINIDTTTESNFLLVRHRHFEALEEVSKHLAEGKKQITESYHSDLFAESLYLAQKSLNKITGKITSNDLLNNIFSNFCVGK